MNSRSSFTLSLVFALGLMVYLVSEAFYTVDQRQVAVLLELGKIVRSDIKPGLHMKIPLVQSVRRFDGRLKTLEQSNTHLLTSDQKDLQAVFFAKWRIADAAAYYRATNYGEEMVARDRLSSLLDRAMRDAFSTRAVHQIVADDQNALSAAILASIQDQVTAMGLKIQDLRVESLQVPNEVADAIYERMRAERLSLATEARARGTEQLQRARDEADQRAQTILAEGYRDAEQLRGTGDAKAAEIYNSSYGQDPEFFRFYRSLNAYREIFNSDRDVLVIQPKGDFFKYFNAIPNEGKH